MYFNCVEGCNEILSQCLKIYKDVENNPAINQWHKIAALRLAHEVQNHKFRMFLKIGVIHLSREATVCLYFHLHLHPTKISMCVISISHRYYVLSLAWG
jgi:hypothetical protein